MVFVPYHFAGEPFVVKFGGNFNAIEYVCDDTLDEKELKHKKFLFEQSMGVFMLVHIGFWEAFTENFCKDSAWYFSKLSSCYQTGISQKLVSDMYKQVEYKRGRLLGKISTTQDENTKKSLLEELQKVDIAPKWLQDICKLLMFMARLGKRPAPNDANDQHETGKELQRIIKIAKNKK
jgi:hypothetical protein